VLELVELADELDALDELDELDALDELEDLLDELEAANADSGEVANGIDDNTMATPTKQTESEVTMVFTNELFFFTDSSLV
jgi:hypothetical protein